VSVVQPRGRPTRIARGLTVAVPAVCGATLAYAGFFLDGAPLWLALAPLAWGLVIGTRIVRGAAMAAAMLWPVTLSGIGLTGAGVAPWLVWPGATAVLVGLSGLAAIAGIGGATVSLLAVPVFPASPLLALADALGGVAHPLALGAAVLATCACLELGPRFLRAVARPSVRAAVLGIVLVPLALSMPASSGAANLAGPEPEAEWRERAVPRAFSEHGSRLLLRAQLPRGGTVVLGENVFEAEDAGARAFWCAAVIDRDVTLFAGVSEPYGTVRRGAIWRLDRDGCANGAHPTPVHRARFGIPGLTGTWGPMASDVENGPRVAGEPGTEHWLICLEAFLPRAWLRGVPDRGAVHRPSWLSGPANMGVADNVAPVLVLSNDGAFGRHADAASRLRRKIAGAMAGVMARGPDGRPRPVLHAETGRTVLILTAGEGRVS